MNWMTRSEARVLAAVLLLFITGLAGKAWLAARPPAELPPLPAAQPSP